MQHIKKILVIDDSEEDRKLFTHYLLKIDGLKDRCVVLEAETADEGYAMIQQHLPDCIILDFMMLDMDGFQFLAGLKRAEKKLPPVIFTTSMHNQYMREDALEMGAHAYLDKQDLNTNTLEEVIQRALHLQRLGGLVV